MLSALGVPNVAVIIGEALRGGDRDCDRHVVLMLEHAIYSVIFRRAASILWPTPPSARGPTNMKITAQDLSRLGGDVIVAERQAAPIPRASLSDSRERRDRLAVRQSGAVAMARLSAPPR